MYVFIYLNLSNHHIIENAKYEFHNCNAIIQVDSGK